MTDRNGKGGVAENRFRHPVSQRQRGRVPSAFQQGPGLCPVCKNQPGGRSSIAHLSPLQSFNAVKVAISINKGGGIMKRRGGDPVVVLAKPLPPAHQILVQSPAPE